MLQISHVHRHAFWSHGLWIVMLWYQEQYLDLYQIKQLLIFESITRHKACVYHNTAMWWNGQGEGSLLHVVQFLLAALSHPSPFALQTLNLLKMNVDAFWLLYNIFRNVNLLARALDEWWRLHRKIHRHWGTMLICKVTAGILCLSNLHPDRQLPICRRFLTDIAWGGERGREQAN